MKLFFQNYFSVVAVFRIVLCLPIVLFFMPNFRRYVQLVCQLEDGGARFCTRDRGQELFFQTAAASRLTGS